MLAIKVSPSLPIAQSYIIYGVTGNQIRQNTRDYRRIYPNTVLVIPRENVRYKCTNDLPKSSLG